MPETLTENTKSTEQKENITIFDGEIPIVRRRIITVGNTN